MGYRQIDNRLHGGGVNHGTGGVVGVANQNRFGAGGNRGGNRRWVYRKVVGDRGGYRHRHPTRKNHTSSVGHKARFGDDNFVTRVNQGQHRLLHGFTDTHRHQNFFFGVVAYPGLGIDGIGDSHPKLKQT